MLLELKDIYKNYVTGKITVQALAGISLKVEKGEFLSIVGPSGSGKTTLLNIIGCIDTPDKGEMILEEHIISEKNEKNLALLRREYFGFIFQSYNLIPVLNVFENIELSLLLLGKYNKKESKELVFEIIKEVGLEGMEYRMPAELSGGQQQRVAIARALVKKPKIVLADEPTANLDSKTGENIIEIMKKMNELDKITFIFSTHDELIMKHAKRIVKLRDGKVIE